MSVRQGEALVRLSTGRTRSPVLGNVFQLENCPFDEKPLAYTSFFSLVNLISSFWAGYLFVIVQEGVKLSGICKATSFLLEEFNKRRNMYRAAMSVLARIFKRKFETGEY